MPCFAAVMGRGGGRRGITRRRGTRGACATRRGRGMEATWTDPSFLLEARRPRAARLGRACRSSHARRRADRPLIHRCRTHRCQPEERPRRHPTGTLRAQRARYSKFKALTKGASWTQSNGTATAVSFCRCGPALPRQTCLPDRQVRDTLTIRIDKRRAVLCERGES